jgi:rhodanese-related sulfurtransferase/DNA-binding transcriptional ArsR family regulator
MCTHPGPKDVLFEQFARVGKAVANPKRLELLDVLAQGERSVESLARATMLKLTTASAHLQALRQGGLVQSRKDGTRIFYRLASDEVARLCMSLREVARKHLAETERAAKELLGEDEVDELDREALAARVQAGNAVLLDVRPESEFSAGHIAGAVSVPVEELHDRLSELPADLEIVAYCRGEYCVLAYEAVRLLRANGRKARRMQGGMLEWRSEGRPVAA